MDFLFKNINYTMKKILLIESHSKLYLRNNIMFVQKEHTTSKEAEEFTFDIDDLETIVLESQQINITTGLLSSLVEKNVLVVTCNKNSMPVGISIPLVANSLQAERYDRQLQASTPLKKRMWQHTIQSKIHNQAQIMMLFSDSNSKCMQIWEKEVKSGDSTNMEARAAQYYWSHLFNRHIKAFKRHRNGLPPNNLLNYGYAIVRVAMIRSLIASGLLTTIGIHHHNKYNPFCLADDIMEPYRPFVDHLICTMLDRKTDIHTIDKNIKAELYNILSTKVLIDEKYTSLSNAISLTANSVHNCFKENKESLLYPIIENA